MRGVTRFFRRIWKRGRRQGTTLPEVLAALSIFVLFAVATAQVVTSLLRLNATAAGQVASTAVANEQIEVMRNLAFDNVGTVGGVPSGLVPPTQSLSRSGHTFSVVTTIRNIDDPFDGTIGGIPNDTAPADYKLVEVRVTCTDCTSQPTIRLVTTIAPNGLETTGDSGALFITVLNASGQTVSGATVRVTNSTVSPVIDIPDTTNANGQLQLVGVPPAVSSYHIEITKSGYSSDGTLAPDGGNPNPVKPDATVATGQVTQVTFAIDVLSTMRVITQNASCAPLGNVMTRTVGAKLVGATPDVLKYSQDSSTDASGQLSRTLEWDSYTISEQDANYTLIGTVGTLPVNLLPNSHQDVTLVLGSPTTNGLHVTVKDAIMQLPIADATVSVTRSGFSASAETGRGYLRQTDWAGGSGQEAFSDETKYQSDDGQLDVTSVPGQVMLAMNGSNYYTSGYLTSSTFDTGGPTNFVNLIWTPASQPPAVGVNAVRFQIATNNDNATWNFVGPDGTGVSYYTVSGETINPMHNGSRYLRYRLFLGTADDTATPIVADASLSFTSGCVPPGQVFFSGLTADDYTVDTTVSGYSADTSIITVNGWTGLTVLLTPS